VFTDLNIDLMRAFVAVAEGRSFTGAAEQLNRTQSAVSMQVRRLEQSLGKSLLVRNSRNVRLTDEGEVMLDYARRILRLNDEAQAEVGQPRVEGKVRLGIPDDYAFFFLPAVLAHFDRVHPRIRLEVYCSLSVDLLPLVEGGVVDLALVTRQPRSGGGVFVRGEQLVWAAAQGYHLHERDPLPLALFPAGCCIFREAAIKRLERAGRSWRAACTSRGWSGIRAFVSAGLALTVVAENTLSPGMRVLGEKEGLPPLPGIEIALHRSKSVSEPAELLAEHILDRLGQPAKQEAG
jgi:DNA-binding transcriptional LysR family regulator